MQDVDALVRSHYNELDRQREHQEYLDEINEMRFAEICNQLENKYSNLNIIKTDDEIDKEGWEILNTKLYNEMIELDRLESIHYNE